ncbi:hypothetical protein C8Q74DRAFT_1230277 [Fomes fomentarius]|nr:hypothetical protein C8Q74DRAFT_1230277 [Fomes fomentarius]
MSAPIAFSFTLVLVVVIRCPLTRRVIHMFVHGPLQISVALKGRVTSRKPTGPHRAGRTESAPKGWWNWSLVTESTT